MKGYSDDINDSLLPSDRNWLIVDDQMIEASNIKSPANRFRKGSHYRNVTLLYIVQNMFDQGRSSQTLSRTSNYTVVFGNLNDKSKFCTIARQTLPENSDCFIIAYEDATVKLFVYLVIDNILQCDQIFRFRTNLFRGKLPTVYCDKTAVY